MAEPETAPIDSPDREGVPDEAVDLHRLVRRWGQEFAIERELAGLGTEPQAWVPLAEAEVQAGVSRSTLRTWYRSGQVASRLVPGPHGLQRLVPLDAVLERTRRSPRAGARPEAAVAPDAPAARLAAPDVAGHEAVLRLAELAATTAAERAERAEARAAEVEIALRAALERAASAETELRLLRAAAFGRAHSEISD